LHTFSVDRSEYMMKPGAKLFFHFVYTQDKNKKKVHYLGNQYILSIPSKNIFLLKCQINQARNDLLKSTYHGFLKMTVHVLWNIALRE